MRFQLIRNPSQLWILRVWYVFIRVFCLHSRFDKCSAKTFTGLLLFCVFLLALTHGALLSCVFLFCFVFAMSSCFLDFIQNSLQLELKVSSPREDLPSILPDDWNPFLFLEALGIQLSTWVISGCKLANGLACGSEFLGVQGSSPFT